MHKNYMTNSIVKRKWTLKNNNEIFQYSTFSYSSKFWIKLNILETCRLKFINKLDIRQYRKTEEENADLRLEIRNDFAKYDKDMKDNLANHTKEINQFFLSIKGEVGKRIYD